MLMYTLLFLITTLSFLILGSRNVVYSLACFISAVVFSTFLLLSINLEFLGYVLVIVYVGAIAILFIFVIMTINVNHEEEAASIARNSGGYHSHVVGLSFSVFVLGSIYYTIGPVDSLFRLFPYLYDLGTLYVVINGANAILSSLYTYSFFYLFVAGLLLLVAMIGATILTLQPSRPNQNSSKQSYRKTSSAVSRSTKD